MYQYTIPKKISVNALNAVNQSSNTAEDLVEKLEAINKKFTSKIDSKFDESDLPKFEKINNVDLDDSALKTQAENDLYDYKKDNVEMINNKFDNEEKTLQLNKSDLKNIYNSQLKEIENYYINAKQSASDDALERGLSRSSIVVNVLDAFDQSQLSTFNALNKELTSNINEINFQLNTLEARQEQALNEFNISYAEKLDSSIAKLKENLFEKQNEIIKYNNEIAEQEADYKIKLTQLNNELNNDNFSNDLDLMELTTKYGANMIQNYKYSQSYDAVKNYLNNLSKEDRVVYLKDQESMLKNYLGSTYYNKLVNEY